MKRISLAIVAVSLLSLPCKAANISYNQKLASQVVGSSTNFTLDLNAYHIDSLSMGATLSSAPLASNSFSDGTQSTGIITVVSTAPLVAASAVDTLTVASNTVLSPTQGSQSILVSSNGSTALNYSTITINSQSIYGTTLTVTSNNQFLVGASSNATAGNIANAINYTFPYLTATVSPVGGGTVTIVCTQTGSFCNNYSIQTSTIALLTSTGTTGGMFTGGADNAYFTITNSLGVQHVYYQGSSWFQTAQASNTAISIAQGINAGDPNWTASTNTTTSVLITHVKPEYRGNYDTLTMSTGALVAKTLHFTGGQDNAFLVVNGVQGTQGTDWFEVPFASMTAKSISNWITGNAVLSSLISSSWTTSGVVSATGTINETGNNYSWYSSTPAALSVSNSGLFGGTNSNYLLNGSVITKTNIGLNYGTGVQVLYTSATITVNPLVNQTTYYVIGIDNNDIQLATTSSGSLAGTFITLTSTSTSGPHSFTLAPLALSGTPTLTWYESNDNANWVAVNTSVLSLVSPWASTTSFWDFGSPNFRYLRGTVGIPTAGGVIVNITGYGKTVAPTE